MRGYYDEKKMCLNSSIGEFVSAIGDILTIIWDVEIAMVWFYQATNEVCSLTCTQTYKKSF